MVSRRSFGRDFKLELCRKVEAGEISKSKACREHALSASLLARWVDQYRAKGEEAFDGAEWRPSVMSPEARVRELEAALGRAHLEIELLRTALAKKGPRDGSSGR